MSIKLSILTHQYYVTLGIEVISTYIDGDDLVAEWIFRPLIPSPEIFSDLKRYSLRQGQKMALIQAHQDCINAISAIKRDYLAQWPIDHELVNSIWDKMVPKELLLEELEKHWKLDFQPDITVLKLKTFNPEFEAELDRIMLIPKQIFRHKR